MKDINDKGFEKFESLDVTNNDKKIYICRCWQSKTFHIVMEHIKSLTKALPIP